MAKRDIVTKPTLPGTTTTVARGATRADAMERQVLAFAQQLGRMAGTLQARTEGWIDRRTLNEQIVKVRDGAALLLDQLAAATKPSKKPSRKKPAAAARGASKGRSGGMVDAPGKKHRPRTPNDPAANLAGSQAAKLRTAKTMVKTNRHRGRG
jgi:hypothetical protein